MTLPPANDVIGRALSRWTKKEAAPEEPGPPMTGRDDPSAAIVTRTEAARALLYAARAGIETVVIDATPDDWTPPECLDAHGQVLPTAVAWTNQSVAPGASLPHRTASGSPCRCRYRAVPSAAAPAPPEPRPVDGRWHD